MSSFQNAPINKQLSATFLLVLFISLILPGIAFIYLQHSNQKTEFSNYIEDIGKITAVTTSRLISPLQSDAINQLIGSLADVDAIGLACIYSADKNTLVSSYQRDPSHYCSELESQQARHFVDGKLLIRLPIIQSNETVGSLVLSASVEKLNQRVANNSLALLIIVLAVSLLIYQLFIRLQKSITKPILALTHITKKVSEHLNYVLPEKTLCAEEKLCAEEITILHKSFAEMVDTLREHEEDLTRSESRLQEIINNSASIISIRDLEGNFIFTNNRFNQLLNIEQDDVIGLSVENFISKEEAKLQLEKESIVIESGETVEFEEIIKLADGAHHFLSVKIPLMDIYQKTYAICSISTEITETKKQAELLKRSQKMEALGKLTGGIAHDYNNMLAIILGFAQLIESQSQDLPKIMEFTHEIMKAGNRGTRLTSRLLAFSREKLAEAKEVNISKLIQSEKNMLEKTLTARISLDISLEENIWPVWLDQDDLEDAILNICINAMHATDGAGGLSICTKNINLSSARSEEMGITAGDYAMIQISDTGFGMDEHTQSHIFDPFFTTKGEEGTGLGLSQVYGFVKRSLGAVIVESDIDIGTTFSLYFPRSKQKVADIKIPVKGLENDYHGKGSILVVDDEPALLALTTEILTLAGYETVEADSAESALQELDAETFDLLLSDVIMPGMSGYELAKIVRDKYPEMKIQLISGYDSNIPISNEDSELKKSLLSKPIGDLKLLKRIKEILS
ncbi:MAG: hypothetical protein DRQ47_01410 [Gammaproteobacteria bacterium]|nr:MAG: hypothetical protein DRQ47_01410 [Gammaproteobacteria bacterium]